MLSFDPEQQTERENYKLLTGSIIPRPIAFVTSIGKDGTLNAAPFSYFNIVSADPPMISLSIQKREGGLKDTARNILEAKEFVVHIVDEDNVGQVNETSASLPPDESEIDLTELTLTDSEKVNVPAVNESKLRFECRLEHAADLHGTQLIVGRIVRYQVDESIYQDGRISYEALKPVSRLAGANYAKLGEVFSLKRPK